MRQRKKKVTKFVSGSEYGYEPNFHTGLVRLTFVQLLKNQKCLLFSSEQPSIDYIVPEESLFELDPSDNVIPDMLETYIAFRGKDALKKVAYLRLLKNREKLKNAKN